MREKELRFALVCYGGISLAVYMHGVTKEIWHVARASRAHADESIKISGTARIYRTLLDEIEKASGTRLRVFADIIAGASAGGINGIFLAQAIATGQSLEPLTDLWLTKADVEELLDPDARPLSRMTKFWAVPIAWAASKKHGNVIDQTVEQDTRDEVRDKLSSFVRARWFEPPFGGKVFCGMLLDAFAAMSESKGEASLLPPTQPLDLLVTVTDFAGYPQRMELNSPPEVVETEHRLTLHFRSQESGKDDLGDIAGLTFAARSTASFPGAFPPFTARELDAVLAERKKEWKDRDDFLKVQLPRQYAIGHAEDTVLIDGSVLANAPFRQAISVLKNRPARREVDRRVIYIDPKPNLRSVRLTAKRGKDGEEEEGTLPGFFTTIFGAMSDIPREQPIRDNVEMLSGMSARIRRMRRIIDAMREEVEEQVQKLFGMTFFLNSPTAARLAAWRATAQTKAAEGVGFGYAAYAHLKLSSIVEDLATHAANLFEMNDSRERNQMRAAMWAEVRKRGLDQVTGAKGKGASEAAIAFFRSFDMGFRIRRLRFLARRLDEVIETQGAVPQATVNAMRDAIYASLAHYFERQSRGYFDDIELGDAETAYERAGEIMDRIGIRCDLTQADAAVDAIMATALSGLPKAERREMLLSYLGFPFYDIATLPLLQGEGMDEYDPIKVDRISPNDATAIRQGGAAATLKGIHFNSFGAFFSRAYRENDYLWGRLHGAERLMDIILSAMPSGHTLEAGRFVALRNELFHAILDEEQERLGQIGELIEEIRGEIG